MSHAMTHSALPDPTYDAAYYEGVLPKRFFAWVIDAGLMLATMVILSIFTAGIAFFLWVPVHFVVSFLYRWSTIRARSATFGMRVMNIELRGQTGARLTSAEAAVHTGSYLMLVVFFVVQLISIGLMLARPLNRGIPDEIVGSVMINKPA